MSFKIKRPNYLSQQFSPIVTLRLGEWRYLLKLVQRNLISRHKATFLFFLWTSSLIFFWGSLKFIEKFLIELSFKQEISLLLDFSNFSKQIFNICQIPFFLKGGQNSFIFFDYMTKSWIPVFEEFFRLEKILFNCEYFDFINLSSYIFPFSSKNLLLCLDLVFFRKCISFRFFNILFFFKIFFFLLIFKVLLLQQFFFSFLFSSASSSFLFSKSNN